MIEAAAVFDLNFNEVYGHYPNGRTDSWIPDSRDLWEFIWKHRAEVGGVAHTHPWDGEAYPSQTDITTFAAIETGLGKRLLWPIITMTETRCFSFNKLMQQYTDTLFLINIPQHTEALRILSENLRQKSQGG
jgi:hypothetical protein